MPGGSSSTHPAFGDMGEPHAPAPSSLSHLQASLLAPSALYSQMMKPLIDLPGSLQGWGSVERSMLDIKLDIKRGAGPISQYPPRQCSAVQACYLERSKLEAN